MSEISEASLKERLWHSMREDLVKYIPQLNENDLLMCCACGRFLPQEYFTLEHLIPKQSLGDDPPEVKILSTINDRSKNILLCSKPLSVRGKIIYENGCNSWKGRLFDRCIREFLNGRAVNGPRGSLTARHNIAIVSLAYLAMLREYGFQIALTASGRLLRRQFFTPNKFLKDMPHKSRVVLAGAPFPYRPGTLHLWTNPFHFQIDGDFSQVVIKNITVSLPLVCDPSIPIARFLSITPSRFILRPDFSTFFD